MIHSDTDHYRIEVCLPVPALVARLKEPTPAKQAR